jgi:hypothetical protein
MSVNITPDPFRTSPLAPSPVAMLRGEGKKRLFCLSSHVAFMMLDTLPAALIPSPAMIATKDSTVETMRTALALSMASLAAAGVLDIDRSDDDRAFFTAEHDALDVHFKAVTIAHQSAQAHKLLVTQVNQARVQLGDVVLDRGVSKGKARMKVELQDSAMANGADHVFGNNVSEITTAERAQEPALVLQAVAKFSQVPAFAGKAELAMDLTTRANNQQKNFADREIANTIATTLAAAEDLAIAAASDALYKLEKRLLERFPRQTAYVKAFFYDVAPTRKKSETTQPGEAPSGQTP